MMDFAVDAETEAQWMEEFEAAARRPLEQRIKYAFIHTYKPVLDDAPFRFLRHDGRLPEMVRGESAGVARLWPGLTTSRPKRFATHSRSSNSGDPPSTRLHPVEEWSF